MNYDLVVIGGGAAGFFGAINTAVKNPKSKILLLEKSNKLLAKVKISGGGRCNVTHACFDASQLAVNYPRGNKELKSAFATFAVNDTINWFEKRGVRLKTEIDGRMFPVTDSSQTIIDCLLQEVDKYNIEVKINTNVVGIEKEETLFKIKTTNGIFNAKNVLITTGGQPKASGYELLTKLGHTIIAPVPSLFTFNLVDKSITNLMGVSVNTAKIKIQGTKLEQTGPVLITHWGISGPATIKLSAWAARLLSDVGYKYTVSVNWLGELKHQQLLNDFSQIKSEHSKKQIAASPFNIPQRLWSYFLEKNKIEPTKKWADISNKEINLLCESLLNSQFEASGKTTFKEEFVTCGGLNLKEVDFKTMQSKLCKGLFFAGEVLDIDGVTGGFNFQNAWTTAYIAAQNV